MIPPAANGIFTNTVSEQDSFMVIFSTPRAHSNYRMHNLSTRLPWDSTPSATVGYLSHKVLGGETPTTVHLE